MTQQIPEEIQQLEPQPCPKPCVNYTQDSVICNEEPERCVMVVCPGCGKIVPHTPYCLNCAAPLHDARMPYEGGRAR